MSATAWIALGVACVAVGLFEAWRRTQRRAQRLQNAFESASFQLERLQKAFQNFVPEKVVEDVIQSGVSLRGEHREVTVLFADLVGFTSLSERMDPADVVELLNGYFRCMSRAITTNNGHVTKFIGDGLMAVFGAPEPNPWQAMDSVRAALAMRAALTVYNADVERRNMPELRVSIGIHTGQVIAGVIGSNELVEYTVIGDVVNTASRIEGLTRKFDTDLLVSQAVRNALDRRFSVREMPLSEVKGRSEKVAIYAVDGFAESKPSSGGATASLGAVLFAIALGFALSAVTFSAQAADPALRNEPTSEDIEKLETLIAKTVRGRPQGDAYVEALVSKAQQLHLAERAEWLRLGHYQPNLFGGFQSEADGELFFLAPGGKDDPQAELNATLRGFFGNMPADIRKQHPVCRFPARFLWLARELSINPAELPLKYCPRYEAFMRRLAPRSVTLVFSSYYLNNPASAFGHTFLRIGRKRSGKAGLELLDSGIDFSATVDTGNALLYAFKGLFGMFPGEFRNVPYSAKVREYNDFESRDIWEYELNLTDEEVYRVVAHLWELGSTYFDYYYLGENCSYHILGALEVANPNLQLLKALGWPVIPADTVKALYENQGLVRHVHYRPSNRSQFRQRIERLNQREQDAVALLMANPQTPIPNALSEAEAVRALDAAIDLIDLRMASDLPKDRDEMDQAGAEAQQTLLERRAAYLVPSEDAEFEPPLRLMPHVGHDSMRLGLASGHTWNRGFFHALSFRFALHDLADTAPGYPDTAEIEFMHAGFRYYVETPALRFEEISLVRTRSLTPLSRFDRSISWGVDVGAERTFDTGCNDCLTAFGELAGGLAVAPFGTFATVFTLVGAKLNAPVDAGYVDLFRVGVGPIGGIRLRFAETLSFLAQGSFWYLPWQAPVQTFELEAKLRWAYFKNFAFGAEGRAFPEAQWVQGVSYLYF